MAPFHRSNVSPSVSQSVAIPPLWSRPIAGHQEPLKITSTTASLTSTGTGVGYDASLGIPPLSTSEAAALGREITESRSRHLQLVTAQVLVSPVFDSFTSSPFSIRPQACLHLLHPLIALATYPLPAPVAHFHSLPSSSSLSSSHCRVAGLERCSYCILLHSAPNHPTFYSARSHRPQRNQHHKIAWSRACKRTKDIVVCALGDNRIVLHKSGAIGRRASFRGNLCVVHKHHTTNTKLAPLRTGFFDLFRDLFFLSFFGKTFCIFKPDSTGAFNFDSINSAEQRHKFKPSPFLSLAAQAVPIPPISPINFSTC